MEILPHLLWKFFILQLAPFVFVLSSWERGVLATLISHAYHGMERMSEKAPAQGPEPMRYLGSGYMTNTWHLGHYPCS